MISEDKNITFEHIFYILVGVAVVLIVLTAIASGRFMNPAQIALEVTAEATAHAEALINSGAPLSP